MRKKFPAKAQRRKGFTNHVDLEFKGLPRDTSVKRIKDKRVFFAPLRLCGKSYSHYSHAGGISRLRPLSAVAISGSSSSTRSHNLQVTGRCAWSSASQ